MGRRIIKILTNTRNDECFTEAAIASILSDTSVSSGCGLGHALSLGLADTISMNVLSAYFRSERNSILLCEIPNETDHLGLTKAYSKLSCAWTVLEHLYGLLFPQ